MRALHSGEKNLVANQRRREQIIIFYITYTHTLTHRHGFESRLTFYFPLDDASSGNVKNRGSVHQHSFSTQNLSYLVLSVHVY